MMNEFGVFLSMALPALGIAITMLVFTAIFDDDTETSKSICNRRKRLQRKYFDIYRRAIRLENRNEAYKMLKKCTKYCEGYDKTACLSDRFCDSCQCLDTSDASSNLDADKKKKVLQHIDAEISNYNHEMLENLRK